MTSLICEILKTNEQTKQKQTHIYMENRGIPEGRGVGGMGEIDEEN